MINNYQFGQITIDGKDYNEDVYITLKGEVKNWWRKESHLFDKQDIKEAVEESPEIIVLGTGVYGVAKVTIEAEDFIKNKGVELVVAKTENAVREYNKLVSQERGIVALLHLTC